MTLRLNGSTSGYTEIDAPAVAGSNTLVLPTGNGSAGQILGTDGAGNLSWVDGRMVLATAQNSTSGTSIDFTSIPSWAKRITVMFNGVSTNGTSLLQVRLGSSSGGIETTGYVSGAQNGDNVGTYASTSTSGFLPASAFVTAAAMSLSGSMVLTLVSGNAWVQSGDFADGTSGNVVSTAGSKTLSSTLDRIRITTVNGTDAFDAGSINILYEG